MKNKNSILVAFLLNLLFAVFEFFGGIYTGSVAVASDAVHDFGDALSIGLAFVLEKKSLCRPDEKYTYGYIRYSVIGSFITTLILVSGSLAVIFNAVGRLLNPTAINYNGMIVFAAFGVAVNFLASLVTRHGDSLNRRAVNLHMLEDVLGWIVVLIGAVVMRFADFWFVDPIMSICVALFILVNAVKNIKQLTCLFLEKTPHGINTQDLKNHLCRIEGVKDVHHIHIRSIDGYRNDASMHVVANGDISKIKAAIREELREYGVVHSTLELEFPDENCTEKSCNICAECSEEHHHHHHHH